jgi:hypothetical protein
MSEAIRIGESETRAKVVPADPSPNEKAGMSRSAVVYRVFRCKRTNITTRMARSCDRVK